MPGHWVPARLKNVMCRLILERVLTVQTHLREPPANGAAASAENAGAALSCLGCSDHGSRPCVSLAEGTDHSEQTSRPQYSARVLLTSIRAQDGLPEIFNAEIAELKAA